MFELFEIPCALVPTLELICRVLDARGRRSRFFVFYNTLCAPTLFLRSRPTYLRRLFLGEGFPGVWIFLLPPRKQTSAMELVSGFETGGAS